MENPLLRPFSMGVSTKSEEAPSRPTNAFFYIAVFALGGLLTALGVGYALMLFLNTLNLSSALLFIGTVIIFAVVLLFQSLMVQSRGARYLLYGAEGLALLAFVFLPISLWLLVASLLFALYCSYGTTRADQYLEDTDRITFFRYSNRFLGGFFTGMTLFAAVLVVGLYLRAGGITEQAFEVLMRGIERPLSLSLGVPVTTTAPVAEIAEKIAEQKLSEQPGFVALPASAQKAAIRETVSTVIATIGEQLSTPVERGETVGAYGYRLLMKAIAHAEALNLGPLILLSMLFLAFIFSKSFVWIIRLPATVFGQILYTVLRGLGVIIIRTESRPKEVFAVR